MVTAPSRRSWDSSTEADTMRPPAAGSSTTSHPSNGWASRAARSARRTSPNAASLERDDGVDVVGPGRPQHQPVGEEPVGDGRERAGRTAWACRSTVLSGAPLAGTLSPWPRAEGLSFSIGSIPVTRRPQLRGDRRAARVHEPRPRRLPTRAARLVGRHRVRLGAVPRARPHGRVPSLRRAPERHALRHGRSHVGRGSARPRSRASS